MGLRFFLEDLLPLSRWRLKRALFAPRRRTSVRSPFLFLIGSLAISPFLFYGAGFGVVGGFFFLIFLGCFFGWRTLPTLWRPSPQPRLCLPCVGMGWTLYTGSLLLIRCCCFSPLDGYILIVPSLRHLSRHPKSESGSLAPIQQLRSACLQKPSLLTVSLINPYDSLFLTTLVRGSTELFPQRPLSSYAWPPSPSRSPPLRVDEAFFFLLARGALSRG